VSITKKIEHSLSSIVKESLAETIGDLLYEGEYERQNDMKKRLSQFSVNQDSDEEVEEDADEDENDLFGTKSKDSGDDGGKKKPKKSKKPKKEPDAEDSDRKEPVSVIPAVTSDDMSNVQLSKVIDYLNRMRSGKSLKDPDIRDEIEAYFRGMDTGERQALFVYLTGLAQVMAGGIDGASAADPRAAGVTIHTKNREEMVGGAGDNEGGPTSGKMVARVGKDKKKSTSATTSTTSKVSGGVSQAPIVVGEHSSLRSEKRRLREINRR